MEIIAIQTFHQLCRSYFADYWGTGLSPVTVNAKKVQLNGNVMPIIGLKRLDEIDNRDVWDILDRMRAKDLSARYIRETWSTARSICAYGVSIGVMAENPFENNKPATAVGEPYIPFTDEELQKVREAIGQGKFANLYGLILESGLMKQMALGLYWEDIDFQRLEITVRRRYISENRNYILVEYEGGGSLIGVTEKAMGYLRQEQSRQTIMREAAGEKWIEDSRFVFTDKYGAPVAPEAPTGELHRLAKANGISRLSMRNLRNHYLAKKKLELAENQEDTQDR